MEQIRILIVSDDAESQRLRDILKDEELVVTGNVLDEDMVLDMITRTNARVAILVDDGSGRFLRCCQQVYMLRPRTIPVIITHNQGLENYQKLIQTGVHYIFSESVGAAELVNSLKTICINETTRIVSLENTSGEQNKSRILMVYGAKDGIGKTAFAVNLAVALAQRRQKVALLDLNLQFGDANVFLGIESKTTISELLQEQSSPGIDLIRRHLVIHSSGVNILCCPRSPEFADGVSGAQIDRIMAAMRSYYDYLILDTAPLFNDVNISCLDAASTILYMTGCDISALRNSRKGLYLLSALTKKEKIKLILGKEHENEIRQQAIEKTLEHPVFASIPYDYKVVMPSLNLGRPVLQTASGSKYARSIQEIAARLDGGGEKPEKKKSGKMRKNTGSKPMRKG